MLDSLDGEQIEVSKERLFPNTFTTLQRVVYEENKIELLKKYLNNDWYNEDCGCYEAHKSKQNIYYGYWSFEAGAIAKILKINDTQLRDTQYYPYDICLLYTSFRGLGGNTNANIIMTPAIRPGKNEVIPVCTRCQTKYPRNQFVKGTTFQ